MRFVPLIIIFVLGSAVAAEDKQMKKLPILRFNSILFDCQL